METVKELIEGAFVDFEDRGFPERALRRDLHQLARNLVDAFFQACTALLPCFASETVEHDRFLAAAVAAQHIDIFDRDEELIAALVFELHAIVFGFADSNRFEAEILADAMFSMNNQIAHAERLQLGEECVGILALLFAANKPVAEDVLLGEQFHLVISETCFHRQDHGRRLALRRHTQRFLPGFRHLDRRASLFEDGRYA